MDPVALRIGPLSIRWYAICILTGLLLGVYLASKEAPKRKIQPDDITDFILWAFPLSILGARLYYVLFSWEQYQQQIFSVFEIWNGGLAIYGGLLTGVLVLYVFTRHRFINSWDFLDVLTPSLMVAQAIGRWGNFFNQEAYGQVVSHLNYLPQFMQRQLLIEGSYRQPTFLYESLWNLLGFGCLLWLRSRPRLLKRGEIFAFYLVWYGCGRLVIEGLRTDSLYFLGVRVSQWLSGLLILLGLAVFFYQRRQTDCPYYLETKEKL